MRSLVIEPGPHFSVQDVCVGLVGGLRNAGVDTVQLNYGDRLLWYETANRLMENEAVPKDEVWKYGGGGVEREASMLAAKGIQAAAFELWPDIVFIVSGFFVPRFTFEILRERGMKVVFIATESPYQDGMQMKIAPFADAVFINDPLNLEQYREANTNTWYLPHAYNPELHKPGPVIPEYASDFAFVGTGYPSRRKFLEAVDWPTSSICLAGNWPVEENSPIQPFLAHDPQECLPNEHTVKVYNSTKVSANLYRQEAEFDGTAEGIAMGPREVELAACGTFFLRDSRPESDEVLSMLPSFDSPGDFSEKLAYYLKHEDDRKALAEKARAAVVDRTFDNNAKMILQHLANI